LLLKAHYFSLKLDKLLLYVVVSGYIALDTLFIVIFKKERERRRDIKCKKT